MQSDSGPFTSLQHGDLDLANERPSDARRPGSSRPGLLAGSLVAGSLVVAFVVSVARDEPPRKDDGVGAKAPMVTALAESVHTGATRLSILGSAERLADVAAGAQRTLRSRKPRSAKAPSKPAATVASEGIPAAVTSAPGYGGGGSAEPRTRTDTVFRPASAVPDDEQRPEADTPGDSPPEAGLAPEGDEEFPDYSLPPPPAIDEVAPAADELVGDDADGDERAPDGAEDGEPSASDTDTP